MPMQPTSQSSLRYSLGFNLSPTIENAIASSDFFSLKNGATSVTASRIGGGGTTSISANGAKVFSTPPANGQSTVSYNGNGMHFFQTPTAGADQSTAVSLGTGGVGKLTLKQGVVNNTQTIASRLASFSTGQWLVLGGVVAGAVLLFTLVKK